MFSLNWLSTCCFFTNMFWISTPQNFTIRTFLKEEKDDPESSKYLFGVGCTPSISHQLLERRTFWSTVFSPNWTKRLCWPITLTPQKRRNELYSMWRWIGGAISFTFFEDERVALCVEPSWCEFESPHRRMVVFGGLVYGSLLRNGVSHWTVSKIGEVVSFVPPVVDDVSNM